MNLNILKRNLDYLKEQFFIKCKVLKEYKANLYSNLFLSIFFTISRGTILFMVFYYFNDLIKWNSQEYYFFIIFNSFILVFFSGLTNLNLTYTILSGKLNNYLCKPISKLWQHLIDNIEIPIILTSISYFILLIYFIIFNYTSLNKLKLVITLIFGLFTGIYTVTLLRAIESTSFFMKNNQYVLNIYYSYKTTFDNFPLNTFKNSGIYKFGLFFPNVYAGFISTQFLFGHINNITFIFHFISLIFLIVITYFLLIISWNYGLKKYEAYG